MNKIRFTKQVIFKDMDGGITHVFNIGDEIEFTANNSIYYVCSPGGIYFDEAEEILADAEQSEYYLGTT